MTILKNESLVSVCIVTYNQQEYIGQAIDSVIAQETIYTLEIIIGEDCSTDNTRQICIEYQSRYPDKIKLLLNETNKGLMQNFISTLYTAKGKYIALCDGDDYWIDPLKLQKQIDFLEKNIEIAFVHSNKKMISEGIINKVNNDPTIQNIEELLLSNFINVSTVAFRKQYVADFLPEYAHLSSENDWKMQDYPLWLYMALRYKFSYSEECMVMYRILSNSLSRLKDKRKAYLFDKSVIDVRKYFYYQYLKVNIVSHRFKYRFNEMVFHAHKRMLLDYGWLARRQILSIIFTNPLYNFFILWSKIKRIQEKNNV